MEKTFPSKNLTTIPRLANPSFETMVNYVTITHSNEVKPPVDPSRKFFQAYTNSNNYFRFVRLNNNNHKNYLPSSDSKLLSLPKNVPEYMEKPLLYFMYLPKY
jgi:hypothetical protein